MYLKAGGICIIIRAIFGISLPISKEEERAIKKDPTLKRSGKKSPRRRREVSLAGRTHSKWFLILGNVFSLVMMARPKEKMTDHADENDF